MFIKKYMPTFAPDDETGAGEEQVTEQQIPLNEQPADGPGSGRGTLRKQLEKNFEQDRKVAAKVEKAPKKPAAPKSRARQEMEAADAEGGEPEEQVEQQEEGGEEAEGGAQVAAPEGWSKEAKADWAALPPTVQAAVAKREADVTKGINDLKARQADIDTALKPRLEMIKGHGKTPGQAVDQLFSWFEALKANPDNAFPALAQSFGYDLRRLFQQQKPQQQQQQQQPAKVDPQAAAGDQAEGQQPDIMTAIKQALSGMEEKVTQRFTALESTFAQQSQAKTQEILDNWSKDKPHFEEVRQTMARLIASGEVPPLQNGSADLDTAYDMALYAKPDIRAKVLADQQQKAKAALEAAQAKEQKAQSEQAAKARKANVGLGPSAPGTQVSQQGKGKKGKSVRESLLEAMSEHSS